MTLTVFLFIRCGLPAVAAMHSVRLLLKCPVTIDLSWWGADAGLFVLLTMILLSTIGLYQLLNSDRASGKHAAVG